MPGVMLSYKCPCGLEGSASPGVDADFMGGYTAAFDTLEKRICTLSSDELKGDARFVELPDPFLNSESSAGEIPVMCPACGGSTLICTMDGNWD